MDQKAAFEAARKELLAVLQKKRAADKSLVCATPACCSLTPHCSFLLLTCISSMRPGMSRLLLNRTYMRSNPATWAKPHCLEAI